MATTYRRQKLNKNVEEIPKPKSFSNFLKHSLKPRQFSSFRSIRGHVTGLGREFALQEDEFCSNAYTTSTYTLGSFVPLNLFHQLSHPANFYFLLISFLQLVPGLSPTSWITTFVPLSCMLLLNGIKDGHYDWNRHQSDKRTNQKKVEVLKDGKFEILTWESVIVGDILKVKSDEELPADMVFLCSSDSQGLAYVETTNFDGDSHLKVRNAIYQKAFKDFNMSPSIFSGLIIKCEHPNNRLYEFEGAVNLQGAGRLFLDETKILLRGARLRNTSWVLGCVIFTGRDTKVLRNMSSVIRKVSNLEGHVNTILPIMLVLSVLTCFAIAVAGNVWMEKNSRIYYVPVESNTWPDYGVGIKGTCVRFIRFFILLHEMIPISLYMSLEVVKVMQCLFVDWDLHMYSSEADRPALARTTGLLEELGQVEYVLVDKTGTLTQNIMAFVSCSIGGVSYGKKPRTKGSETATPASRSVHLVAQDDVLKGNFTANSDTGRLCSQFFTHLALCHNVYPRMVEELPVKYEAASPDDAALVQGAAECGFHLEFRNTEEIHLYLEGVGLEKHTVLAVLDFTWDRKRMSVICKNQQGRLKLYCKGADSVILRRLRDPDSSISDATVQHIEEFSRNGYRTLCIAERELTEKEFETWAGRFLTSTTSADDRQALLAIAAETIERDMVLLGATAVEDKLQEGVAETVTQLAQAGIRIWVLTGDKMETAVTISLSCNLLADSMHLFLLPDVFGKFVGQMLRNMLEEARRHFGDKVNEAGSRHSDMAVVIEGHSLRVALEMANRETFLRLCQLCRTVIFCRVTPVQKVQVTRLVRSYGFMVAAVGDGANDVGMIKAAQIGVGIYGREGNAAVAASDYAIAQFRFLARLLIVHGRWSFTRNKDLALYTIYKNIVFVLANFFFSFYSAYSAQSIFPELLLSTYNLLWTLLPVIAVAILERDVCHYTAENSPQLYLATQIRGTYKFAVDVCQWTLSACWHAIVAFFLPYFIMHQSEVDGESIGLWTFGGTIYVVAVVIVNVKLAVHVSSWVLIQISVLCFTVCSLPIFLLLLSVFLNAKEMIEDLDSLGYELFRRPIFWLLIVLSPIAACLPDIVYIIFRERANPADATILRELENGWRDGELIKGSLDWVEVITSGSFGKIKELVGIGEVEEDADADVMESPFVAGAIARRKTWREIVSDERFDATDHTNSATWDGKKKSSGFHMVTRLSAPHRKPKPLHEGPTPPRRMSAKGASLGLAKLKLPKQEDDVSSESKWASKNRWKIISRYYRLGAGVSASKSGSGRKESLRSRMKKSSVMGRRSIMKSPHQIDLEGGPQQPKKEKTKPSLRKSDAAKSHLHVMIAPDAKGGPLPISEEKKSAKKATFNPYYHESKSHTHVLTAADEEGPDPFKEDTHKTSLQIMINPNAKDKPNVDQQSEKNSPAKKPIANNPYYNVNRPRMDVLISSDGPTHSQGNTNTTSLQIMINPNVKNEGSHYPEESTNELSKEDKIKRNPYFPANRPHTNVLISSDGAGPSHSQENTNMTSLQIMINPNVKDEESHYLQESTNELSEEYKIKGNSYFQANRPHSNVLISSDGAGPSHSQENTNMTSLQIMINSNVKDEPNVAQQSPNRSHMNVLVSNDSKGEENTDKSSLQIIINPNSREEQSGTSKESPEVLPGEEKIDIDRSSDVNKQNTNDVNEMTPPYSSENEGEKEPVEASAAISESQSQTTSDVGAQTRTEADVMSEPVLGNLQTKIEERSSNTPESKPEKKENGKNLQATYKQGKSHQTRGLIIRNPQVDKQEKSSKKKSRRATLA